MAKTRVTSQDIGDGLITDTDVASANKDGAVGTASMRTLGTGAAQAAQGSHGHTHAATTGQTATDHHPAPAAGPDADTTIDAAGAVGTAATFARSGHGHQLVTRTTAPAAIGTAAAGTSGATPARGDHVHATGAGTPSTQAFGDAAAVGTGPAAAMTDHKHAMPTGTAGPDANVTIDSAGAAGTANTAARSAHGHQVATTDAPSGANISIDAAAAAAATGAIARAAHGHRLNTSAAAAVALGAAAAGTSGHSPSRDDHVHPTTGLALDPHGAAQHTDITRKIFLAAAIAKLDGAGATSANIGASPDLTGVVALADGSTEGAFWSFEVPADWASGVITLQPVWSPGATDAVAHTVRWSMTAKAVASGSTITAAGTTTAFTGASAARTVGVVVYDTATSTTLTPAAAGDLFRFELQRIGADAADSYVGVVNLLGVIVSYTASQ